MTAKEKDHFNVRVRMRRGGIRCVASCQLYAGDANKISTVVQRNMRSLVRKRTIIEQLRYRWHWHSGAVAGPHTVA
jgi:hypothetical protein